jgi:hypothetical protein
VKSSETHLHVELEADLNENAIESRLDVIFYLLLLIFLIKSSIAQQYTAKMIRFLDDDRRLLVKGQVEY